MSERVRRIVHVVTGIVQQVVWLVALRFLMVAVLTAWGTVASWPAVQTVRMNGLVDRFLLAYALVVVAHVLTE